LRKREQHPWNYFINLSGSSYPLVNSAEILEVFDKHFQGTQHFNILYEDVAVRSYAVRYKNIHLDPAITLPQKVVTPRIRKGSEWGVFSAEFAKYVISAALPRRLLLLMVTFASTSEFFIPTALHHHNRSWCRIPLHYDCFRFGRSLSGQHPYYLDHEKYWNGMIESGALFARKFRPNSSMLTTIDERLLKRFHPIHQTALQKVLAKIQDTC